MTKAKGEPSRVVFSGVGKTRDEMARAHREGILLFNVESAEELELLDDVEIVGEADSGAAALEQIALHRRLEPGQFSECLGLGGGHGPLERQQEYWLKRCQELGAPCGQWAQGVLQRKGPIGLRTLMGLPLAGSTPSVRACDACSRVTLVSVCSTSLLNGFQNSSSSGTHSRSPRDTASRSSSMRAVNS